jgi:hypothetical protein
MNRIKVSDLFSTSDLGLANTIALWYPLDSIDHTNPKKAQFLFKRDTDFDKLIEAYWKQELRVEPQRYFNQLKIIKSRLYSEK